MKKILVFNLTRLGDLLQSTPMLCALRSKYPDAQIFLIVNRTFLPIVKFIPFVDSVLIFDIKKFKPALTGKEISLVKVYRYIESLLDELINENFDMVLNLTHSKLSAMFSNMIGASEQIGLVATDFGNRKIKGPWINYFCNMVFNREFNRFNLVDIYAKSVGFKVRERRLFLKGSEEVDSITNEFVLKNSISQKDLVVGFQPGSSRKDRRWPTASFVKLSDKLQGSFGVKIVLFGTSAEEDIGNEIESLTIEPVINTIGKTNIEQLIGTLKRVDVLVTNDTGTMHIASALGVKVVALFFAHAWCFETGPYGEGHIILQADISCSPCSHNVVCNNMICKDYIKIDDVYEVVRFLIKKNKTTFELSKDNGLFQKVKVLTPVFDRDGMYDCLPVVKCQLTDRDIIGMVYKEVWKKLLDGKFLTLFVNKDVDCFQEDIVTYVSNKIIKYFSYESAINRLFMILEEVITSFKDLSIVCNEGIVISEELLVICDRKQSDINLVKRAGEKLSIIDERIELMGTSLSALRPLIQLFKFGKENLDGDNVRDLVKDTQLLYQKLYMGSYLMYKVLKGLEKKII